MEYEIDKQLSIYELSEKERKRLTARIAADLGNSQAKEFNKVIDVGAGQIYDYMLNAFDPLVLSEVADFMYDLGLYRISDQISDLEDALWELYHEVCDKIKREESWNIAT